MFSLFRGRGKSTGTDRKKEGSHRPVRGFWAVCSVADTQTYTHIDYGAHKNWNYLKQNIVCVAHENGTHTHTLSHTHTHTHTHTHAHTHARTHTRTHSLKWMLAVRNKRCSVFLADWGVAWWIRLISAVKYV